MEMKSVELKDIVKFKMSQMNKYLVCCYKNNSMKVYENKNLVWEEKITLKDHKGPILSLDFYENLSS